jgi:hypothetical protein
MIKPEKILILAGMAVVACAVLLVAYATFSNAEARAITCSGERSELEQTLDQVRFDSTAEFSVSSAIEYSAQSRLTYGNDIAALRRQLASSDSASVNHDLGQASEILSNQEAPINQAHALASEVKNELRSALPFNNEALQELQDGDCSALSLTMARSGWPKDQLLGELVQAARLDSAVSEQLTAALALITHAQHRVH